MEKTRLLTCIVCPRGCQMKITFNDDYSIKSVEGNFCKRGATYANDECFNPRRTVTSTLKRQDGGVISVKTDRTVPKDKVFEVMKEINRAVAKSGTKIGDIIIENVCDTGANVVATSN